MPDLHHNIGIDGLRLRTERGVQELALANAGPLLGGAYATAAELEAAETGRVVAELALDTPGALCLAVRDLAGLLPRVAGDPNPQYTLYRIAPVPQDGVEPEIRYGTALRLESMADPCNFAALWQIAMPVRAALLDDALDLTTGWTVRQPKLAGSADDPMDSRTGWTIGPDVVPSSGTTTTTDVGQTTGTAVDSGADLTYLTDTAANFATAETNGWKAHLRWWANSNGPFTQEAAPTIRAWHTIWPGAIMNRLVGSMLRAPAYLRDSYPDNGKGRVSTGLPGPAEASVLSCGAQPNFAPQNAWAIFIVATAHNPLRTAEQSVLFETGPIGNPAPGVPLASLAIQAGTTTQGIRLCFGTQASRTFVSALATNGALQIVEAHAAAGAAVGAWALTVNGAPQAEAAVSNGALVPAWPANPDDFSLFGGRTGAHLFGACSEVIIIQTNDPTLRTAVRQYLATKFAITIS